MNGYPDHITEKTIAFKLKAFKSPITQLVGNSFS